MRFRSLVLAALLLVLLTTACQGPPPTLYVLVVTATPDVTLAATPDVTSSALASTATVTPTATTEPTPMTMTPQPTANSAPTPTIAQIQVAEQIFQKGRMFWLQPTNQIWVMINSGDGLGIWRIYQDTFVEGEAEFDPTIRPPEGLLQPERGFGKLWRSNPEVRESLGWALEPELGHVSNYEYEPEGEMVEDEFVSAPGYHLLSSFYGDTFRFNEVNSTWQLIPRQDD